MRHGSITFFFITMAILVLLLYVQLHIITSNLLRHSTIFCVAMPTVPTEEMGEVGTLKRNFSVVRFVCQSLVHVCPHFLCPPFKKKLFKNKNWGEGKVGTYKCESFHPVRLYIVSPCFSIKNFVWPPLKKSYLNIFFKKKPEYLI